MTPWQKEITSWCIVIAIICATSLVVFFSWKMIAGSLLTDLSQIQVANQIATIPPEVRPAQPVDDGIDRSQPRSENDPRPVTLDGYPDEEKNRIWWEIASRAEVRGELSRTYRLSFDAVAPVAIKYGVTESDIYTFFRQGASAAWRSDEPPPPTDDEK